MTNIEKQHIINENNLSAEFYFTSLLQETFACGILSESNIEKIQTQCLEFLSFKSERYNGGESSSIRVEVAENIMKSNLYTIGLYLKSWPDADRAVSALKTVTIPEMYQKGREIIDDKLQAAKHSYKLAQDNKLYTINYTYNATINDSGIGIFFKEYNPDYEAHEFPASIDYQLCNPVTDLVGVEFIEKYLENLFLENEFCNNFAAEDIHHLLCGYDEGYQDLLINIFEHVLTAALGCLLARHNVVKLDISTDEIQLLYNELSTYNDHSLALAVYKASEQVFEELNITSPSLRRYIEKSLPQITSNIAQAIKTNNLHKVFVSPFNPDLKPRIKFSSGVKMADEDYRNLIDELLLCRYSPDKLGLIKERVKSFDDLEDILFDAHLSGEEINLVFSVLEDVEIAALVSRHPFISDIQAVDLSEAEQSLRLYLKNYIDRLPPDRQEQVFEIMARLEESIV
ncbi:hypothetical protein Ga0466249_001858 [Sporomusaceae bacterium BoRhaA]|uniref:DUF6179 domain-containing protein n=1 Tax=Pelorhabdus rhamnosifermentans TaxID=2772457 RepID=UPI001C06498D|nr:DUF6179 domain-containing protein [Pelorhabdus rhamnosifermentans]MBU2700753.1 hypothetical protein [Pelorhabdus rhamnosifermentans]